MSNKTTRSGLILAVFLMLGKLLGFLREMLTARSYGAGESADAYFAMLGAAVFVGGMLSNLLNTILIPLMSELGTDKQLRNRKLSNIATVTVVFSVLIGLISYVFAPLIVRITAQGFSGSQYQLSVDLIRIGTPISLLMALAGLFMGINQSHQQHTGTAFRVVPFNIVYIIYLLFFASRMGIRWLMVISVIAYLAQVLVLWPEARSVGFRYHWVFDLKDPVIRKLLVLGIPLIVGSSIGEINSIVTRTLGSGLPEGTISALNYATKLNQMVFGVFVTAITTVIFPLLSDASHEGAKAMHETIRKGFDLITAITVPAAFGMMFLAEPIVDVVFKRGEFTDAAARMTTQALIFLSLSLLATSLQALMTRAFYAVQDTRTPLKLSIVNVLTNIALSLALTDVLQIAGLALANSLSTILAASLMVIYLYKKIGGWGIHANLIELAKVGLASVVMGLVALLSFNQLRGMLGTSAIHQAVALLVAITLGVLVFVAIAWLLRVYVIRNILKGKNVRDRDFDNGD